MLKILLLTSRLLAVSVFVLIAPASVFAQTTHADLSLNRPHLITTNDPARDQPGFNLRNDGPDAARDVLVSASSSEGTIRWTNCPRVSPEGCLFPIVGVGLSENVWVGLEIENAPFPGEVTINAKVSSPVHDPNPRNNQLATTITLVRAPSLRLSISGDVPAGPGERVTFEATLFNDSSFEARDVLFSFDLSGGWRFQRSLSEALDCTTIDQRVTCAMGNVDGKNVESVKFELEAPDDAQGSVHHAQVTLSTKDGVFGNQYSFVPLSVFRDLPVTNRLDDGDGSLRKVIQTANDECGITAPPCRIVFHIADDGSAVQTIRPLTPLPSIAAYGVTIDGGTRTERVGDTNPHGPEIEINGSLLDHGNGLEFRDLFTLRNVVINGFPGSGVLIDSRGAVENCVIGTNPAGTTPVPNQRGITVTSDDFSYSAIEILNNLISGNHRSAIFVTGGTKIRMIGNRIGVAAGPELRPLPNGASGIYLGPRDDQALVQKNVIAFNAHAGIGTAPDARHTGIRGNAIFSNGGLAIDHGLDGVSSEGISFHTPPVPLITSVHHDATAGITTIRGTFNSPTSYEHVVELFVSDSPDPSGYGEAQAPVGQVPVQTDGSFELRHEGNLRGRYLTATGTSITYGWDSIYASTSEMSRAVRVDGEAEGEIPPSVSLPDGADLSITGNHFGPSVAAGVGDRVSFTIENLGPHVAEDVVVEITAAGGITLDEASQPCTRLGEILRCTLGTIGIADGRSIHITTRTPLQTVRQLVEAVVSTRTTDPDPTNNRAVLEFDVTPEPVWNAHLRQSTLIADPGDLVVFDMTLAHQSGLDASDVLVTLPIPEGWSFVAGSEDRWQCEQVSSSIVCRAPLVAAGSAESFTFTLRAPQEFWSDRATYPVISSRQAESRELPTPAFFETWTWLPVTTTSDSGPGSFRAAVEELNMRCRHFPCKIVFAIPLKEMEGGAAVIRPLTPLPVIGAPDHFDSAYEIDGRTQPRAAGAAMIGPVVVLDGSLLTLGSGLELAGRQGTVRGLAIHGFPGDGVALRTRLGSYSDRSVIADNYIGTDSEGQTALPNRRWGISINGGTADVVSNVISGNGRSAVFSASTPSLRIVGNQIGVAAGDPSQAVPNGASAVYIGGPDGEAEICANTLANSPHFGVAISNEAGYVAVRGNSIFANGGIGIDHGLDSVTFNDDPERPEDLPPYPVILSARWDESVQATRIEGTVESWGLNGGLVELFANTQADPSGFGEARELIATVYVGGSSDEDTQHFSALVEPDLRGQFVTATWTRHHGDGYFPRTSEISAAVPVE